MNPRCVIVDANIAFRALTTNRGDLRDRLSPSANLDFYSPRFLFVELFKHKERLSRAARMNEDELLEALHTLVNRLEFVTEANIPIGIWGWKRIAFAKTSMKTTRLTSRSLFTSTAGSGRKTQP